MGEILPHFYVVLDKNGEKSIKQYTGRIYLGFNYRVPNQPGKSLEFENIFQGPGKTWNFV